MSTWNTTERLALREMVTSFTEKEIAPHLPAWEDAGQLPRELHRKAADVGLLGIGFAEEIGGSGGDIVDATIMTEAVMAGGGSTGLLASLFTHGIAIPHIVDGGDKNADLIDRYVRPTLAGEKIGSLGITEPGGGSDVSGLTTRAVRDGDEYVVNGAKTFITSGVRADFVTTAVRTGGAGFGGISLLVIDKGLPGFTVSKPLRKMGWHCSDTAELTFDDVRVPAANIVGDVDGGFGLIVNQFVNERLSLATQAYATAQRSLDLAIAYSKQRETFGKPLATRQVIRHKLVEMHSRTAAARALTREAVEQAAAGQSPLLEAVVAKNVSVAACEWVVSEAVQIFGGMGYMRESEVERHYRDARILGIGGGATEVMTDLAAKLMGL
ncbi:acyl-CoA dehydrogenase family protein [Aeromicrobium fastidiosum]|uniref:Acyl-CoA dehydrogenase n=1 Tax=Aeromicrobium fastidiosum TaxID=52699 RepID=A0A641AQ67_9ACTN|nr:acyl-CoA dehydrogenase family protein [Aeromicrobium fastidiosum]KAA1380230.1 acyl-CoA dehydrogenase [Aeromicrobium fastidiosum]MBP2389780.1 acyl-CoA dehydrogenase [Aeromicrobium fastidiosum]